MIIGDLLLMEDYVECSEAYSLFVLSSVKEGLAGACESALQ
jgi:hypothetical protein